MMEAAACGLQLIAPDHSAYQEYLQGEIAFLLPAREVEATLPPDVDTAVFFNGTHWWEPDEQTAAQVLRGILDGTVGPKASARAKLLSSYSWEQTASRLLRIIERV